MSHARCDHRRLSATGEIAVLCACICVPLLVCPAPSTAQSSDGSDGLFHPSGNVTLDLPENGVFNFTDVTIDAGIRVRFNRNASNTPVYLLATGDIVIDGTVDVSARSEAELHERAGGPGGGNGGAAGIGDAGGGDGSGLSPGGGGPYKSAGGGGGMATPGEVAIRHTGPSPAAGGPAIPYPGVQGGSGGGGGGGLNFFGVLLGGGNGGGGGGAILLTSPGAIRIRGQVLANGATAGYAYANAFQHAGPGGGGSGGVIELRAASLILEETCMLETVGGQGGGIGTIPVWDPNFPSGATGGQGFIRLDAPVVRVAGVLHAWPIGLPADFDDDGDVDLTDFSHFQGCFNGPNRPAAQAGCEDTDLDGDADVDLADFFVFQGCFNGPNRPPACE
jgi:hypothetical protein